MDNPRDSITLTSEERRILAVLEDRLGSDDPKLGLSLTTGSRTSRLHPHRIVDIAAVLLFLAGVALMLVTFAERPVVGVVGVVAQAIALWVIFARWAPRIGVAVRRQADKLRMRLESPDPPGRRSAWARWWTSY